MVKARKNGTSSRNPDIGSGVGKYSRSAMVRRSGKWAIKSKAVTPKAASEGKIKRIEKKIDGAKNGGKRVVTAPRIARLYPTEDVPKNIPSRKLKQKAPKGAVLIVLAGKYAGKRVVCLGILPSGLALITGPYALNGVPLRRVNPAYVIATKTEIALPKGLKVEKFNDAYFARKEDGEEKKPAAERLADQKVVDGAILGALKGNTVLTKYLRVRFSLRKGQYPHAMVF